MPCVDPYLHYILLALGFFCAVDDKPSFVDVALLNLRLFIALHLNDFSLAKYNVISVRKMIA